ncbi:MAG: glutamine synthetase, partial [Nocardioidaceae bacterium]
MSAQDQTPALRAKGVVGVVAGFVDNAGIARVKAVPLDRLPDVSAWGVGATPCFDAFGFDDQIAVAADGTTPVGDLRVMPDLDRLVPLAAHPGWAWAPSDRYDQQGEPHPGCSRSLLRRLVADVAEQGMTMRAAFEVEWVVSTGDGDAFVPATSGPGYGLQRLCEVSG